jgi:hypothetical protein
LLVAGVAAAKLIDMFSHRLAVVVVGCALGALGQAEGQNTAGVIEPKGTARAANSEGTYLALRGALPVGEGAGVKDLTIEREGGRFHFAQGTFYFHAPVNQRVTGAVFVGSGHFDLTPEDASERHSLSLLNKSGAMSQDFNSVVLRFTDGTAEEIRTAAVGQAGAATSQAGQMAAEFAKSLRSKLHENLALRLLSDVWMPEAKEGEYFLASFRMGGTFTGRNVLFVVDPEDLPDQVQMSTWSEDDSQTWAGYRMHEAHGFQGVPEHVSAERLDVQFEKSGVMHNTAETTVMVRREGLRVIRLNLYPTLRVSGVYDEMGMPLDFVQEGKDNDPEFAVLLPKGAAKGQALRVSKNFTMLVPIYLQTENGNVVRIARIRMNGEDMVERTLKLGKLPSPWKKLLLNYNADVLSD